MEVRDFATFEGGWRRQRCLREQGSCPLTWEVGTSVEVRPLQSSSSLVDDVHDLQDQKKVTCHSFVDDGDGEDDQVEVLHDDGEVLGSDSCLQEVDLSSLGPLEVAQIAVADDEKDDHP
jgi:hypothetical protein